MSHYSLRWNNHQTHILQAFDALLQAEVLVDVTLVCAESSLKAHKVVLSACSPFFERIFAEHPCKHPVIVLKDFPGHDVAALIDFMYRGEVRVGTEELPGLIRAAESLQVRGLSDPILSSVDPRIASPPETPSLLGEPPTPEGARQDSPEDDDHTPESTPLPKELAAVTMPTSFRTRDHRDRLPFNLNFLHNFRDLRENCSSPLMPRRKQACPRRRSGELIPQDLSRSNTLANSSPSPSCLNLSTIQHQPEQQQHPSHHQQQSSSNTQSQQQQQQQHQQQQQQHHQQQQQQQQQHHHHHHHHHHQLHHHHEQQQQQQEDVAENLSMKRSVSPSALDRHRKALKTESSETASSPRCSPLTGTNLLHPDGSFQDSVPTAAAVVAAAASVGLQSISTLSLTSSHHPEYLTNLSQLTQWLPQNQLPPPPPLPPPGSHPPREGHLPREDSPHVGVRPTHPYQQQSQQQQQQRQDSPLPSRRSSVAAMFPSLDGLSTLYAHTSLDRTNFLDLNDFKPDALRGIFGASLGAHHSSLTSKKPKKYRGNGDAPRRWSDPSARGLPMDRPKGQHSAPRGGPPRSWTNAELTEALQQVWNKKMTTSQASRIYGIPYNSLLMYVRGKYGKSLKLEQLRRDCTATNNPEYMNAVNNNVKAVQQTAQLGHSLTGGLPPSHPGDDGNSFHHHPLLSGNIPPQGFYPDFTSSFPMPVNMVHLLPPSEQKGFESSANPGSGSGGGSGNGGGGGGGSGSGNNGGGDLATSQSSRTPSPLQDDDRHHRHHESSLQPSTQSAPALLQHNGSD